MCLTEDCISHMLSTNITHLWLSVGRGSSGWFCFFQALFFFFLRFYLANPSSLPPPLSAPPASSLEGKKDREGGNAKTLFPQSLMLTELLRRGEMKKGVSLHDARRFRTKRGRRGIGKRLSRREVFSDICSLLPQYALKTWQSAG